MRRKKKLKKKEKKRKQRNKQTTITKHKNRNSHQKTVKTNYSGRNKTMLGRQIDWLVAKINTSEREMECGDRGGWGEGKMV